MENEHRKIDGYRELTKAEINAMNDIKGKVDGLRWTFQNLPEGADGRCAALAITKLEECSMWGVRAIAKPQSG